MGYDPTKGDTKKIKGKKKSTVKPNVVKPLKDSERIKKNKIDTQKADAFKRTTAYKTMKADIDAKKGLRDAGASGDFSPTMPQSKREAGQKIRDARTKKYNIPDPFTIDTSSAAADNAKKFGTPKPKSNVNISSVSYTHLTLPTKA